MSHLHLEREGIGAPGGLVSSLLAADPQALSLFPPGGFGMEGSPGRLALPFESALGAEAFHCPDPGSRERLASVLSGEGLVVTTGQQPQLFGGPLYVLYKAVSAVQAAADLERRLGTACLAVFWVAGDDHDWQEVASVEFLDKEEHLRGLGLQATPHRAGRSVGPSELPIEIQELTRDFVNSLETQEVGERWLRILQDHYIPGRSFTEAFIGAASSWMRGLPIAFLDSAHPDVRRASSPFVQRVIEERVAVDDALRRGTAAVAGLGYRVQLTHAEGAIPLFREGVGGRYRLRGVSGPVQIDREGLSLEVTDLVAEAGAEPGLYSPSAGLRPVLESWLLPVGATVLGPGEIAYWSQIGPTFDTLDVPMPLILPRGSWRVVEPRVARLLEKTGVSADDLRDGGAAAAIGLVERSRPRAVEGSLLKLEDRVEEEFDNLESAVASDLPALRSAVGKSRSQAFSSLANLRKTLDRATRDREATALGQLRRAATNLYPDGIPQERAMATWVYLARYGDTFLEAVRAAALQPSAQDGAAREGGVAGASPAD